MRLVAAMLLLVAAAAWGRDYQGEGRNYLASGETELAVESFAEAVRLNPFDAVALNNLAVAKAAAGDYQGALTALERAVRFAPTRSDIATNLTRLRAKLGGELLPRIEPAALSTGQPQEIPPLWRKP